MIRILTSLVALFTVTSIQTQAALNQYSKLTRDFVDEQRGSCNSNLLRQTFAKQIFQQVVKHKISSQKKVKQQLFASSSTLNWNYTLIQKSIIIPIQRDLLCSNAPKKVFHIRSPNFLFLQ